MKTSPAWGTSFKPRISTGVDGPAFFTRRPLSSIIALILPNAVPTVTLSPTFSVPFWTSTVATGPRPLSSCASRIRPRPFLLGFAFNSFTSASRRIISSRSWRPSPVCAETGTIIVVPPQSSAIRPYSVSSCLTRSILALGLSILLIATIISISAALAWLMASIVWGITPSSAATTRIAISVDCAPLKRMAVKASCPGVSRNVIFWPLTSTT